MQTEPNQTNQKSSDNRGDDIPAELVDEINSFWLDIESVFRTINKEEMLTGNSY